VPTVLTLNQLLEGSQVKTNRTAESNMNDIVTEITFNILQESPKLVADIANGIIDKKVLETAIIKNIDKNKYNILERDKFIKRVFDFMFGYGPLQEYLEDESISDIDGTKYNEFTITRKGMRQKIDIDFGSEEQFDKYCKLLVRRNYGIINENDSHCRVTDNQKRLRINVSVPPRNISGPAISIRKHPEKSLTLDELQKEGMLDEEIEVFLKKLAVSDANVVISGKGAAGKTTLLKAIINNMPELDRVLICEKDAEIFPEKPNCIEQRVKKEGEGGRTVTLRDLIKDGLTMSLDTYVIGESVEAETWEGIRAALSGHRFLTTTHSRKAYDCLERLLTLSKMANIGESEDTVKDIIGRSIDCIIHMEKFKIVNIVEILGYDKAKDDFIYNELYKYDKTKHLKTNNFRERLNDKLGGEEI